MIKTLIRVKNPYSWKFKIVTSLKIILKNKIRKKKTRILLVVLLVVFSNLSNNSTYYSKH